MDKAACVSHCTNVVEKDMDQSLLVSFIQLKNQTVEQNGFSSLVRETSMGKGKTLNSKPDSNSKKMWHIYALFFC